MEDTRLIPRIKLDLNEKNIEEFTLAIGIEKFNPKMSDLYIFKKQDEEDVLRSLKEIEDSVDGVEKISEEFGEKQFIDYINIFPAELRGFNSTHKGNIAIYRIDLDPKPVIKEKKKEKKTIIGPWFIPGYKPSSFDSRHSIGGISKRKKIEKTAYPESDDLKETHEKIGEAEEQSKKTINAYSKAQELLKEGLDYHNAETVHSKAEEYCNACKKSSNLNPMISCVNICEVWYVKNAALKLREKSKITF